ncbi:aldo-keto reductase AKR2E4-like [Pectinophora gossypiella]|uniref:aldo-keto reductase AKR2E4-like n=1 Tax=Pectinophora gossypiella TaxID=13191 RepID=UPI00214EB284|nr:aldo-keto reductase AKR2E4-like [Pectinophora gossypiella]
MWKFLFVLCAVTGIHTEATGKAPWIRLNSGRNIPTFGLGTWLGMQGNATETDDSVENAVKWAIDAGYRLIDTASIYKTEEQVGRGIAAKIADGTLKDRSELFVVTKLWNDAHEPKMVVPALRESLGRLNLTYVDLYLIHWPIAQHSNGSFYNTDYVDTWKAMLEARDEGLARSVGVSNFNIQQLDRVISLSPEKPAVNQVEINLNLQQPELLEYLKRHNIAVMGYTPFGSLFHQKAADDAPPPRIDDPALIKIAEKYKKTVTQIALRYLVELGVIPIPKSVTKNRIEQNVDIFDFSLTQDERDQIKKYDHGYRTIAPAFWKDSPYYPFK